MASVPKWKWQRSGNLDEHLTSFLLTVESKPCVSSRKLSPLPHSITSQTGPKNDQATRRILLLIEICYCFEFPCFAL